MNFDDFWAAYPSRRPHANPKAPARRKFESLVKSGVDPCEIVAGTNGYKAALGSADTDPMFVCQAITYPNQERWRDYLPTEEELAEAAQSKQNAMKANSQHIKRGDRPDWVTDDMMEELLSEGQITAQEARAVGYIAKVKIV